jgi:hypothetical protein
MRTAIYAPETEEAFILLLEIDNPDDPSDPIRVALNNDNVTSTVSGRYSPAVTFAGGLFHVELPAEDGENINTVRIAVDNVDQRIVQAIRNTAEPPDVRLWIVSSRDVDAVEVGPYRFEVESAEYDSLQVRAELVFENVVNRRWPSDSFTPATTPGIF